MLWVCDKCFKYMSEGLSWELHVVRLFIHPSSRPGDTPIGRVSFSCESVFVGY